MMLIATTDMAKWIQGFLSLHMLVKITTHSCMTHRSIDIITGIRYIYIYIYIWSTYIYIYKYLRIQNKQWLINQVIMRNNWCSISRLLSHHEITGLVNYCTFIYIHDLVNINYSTFICITDHVNINELSIDISYKHTSWSWERKNHLHGSKWNQLLD